MWQSVNFFVENLIYYTHAEKLEYKVCKVQNNHSKLKNICKL